MLRLLAFSTFSIFLGCVAHSSSVVILRPGKVLNAPREVVIVGQTHGAIADVFRRYLMRHGFRIRHWAIKGSMSVSRGNKVVSGDVSAAPYVIELRYAGRLLSQSYGCADLDYIRADVVDTASNEVILSTRGAGRTDPCGRGDHVLRDIVDAMDRAWGSEVAPSELAPSSTSL